jgi:glycosyltransferase involved in cell wall biosynthesis
VTISLDASYSLGRNLSGVGVYCRQMLAGLAGAHPEARFHFYYRPHRFLASFREFLPANARRRPLVERVTPGGDLFHGLNQRLPRARARRTVVTFHDLFVLTGEYSTPQFRARFAAQARRAAAQADRIIAVSAFTAGQVCDLLGVEPARVRVVHHGVTPLPRPAAVRREKIILHVGAIQARKNIARLVRAFESVGPEWRLVLAGSAGYGAPEILAGIAASPARRRIEVAGYVGPEALAEWYARASLFAFPSLDEGFGMPVIEAMAAGVPVLTSNRAALPEVAGGAALLVNPVSVEEIAAALARLTADETLRRDLAHKGYLRASAFTWDKAVEETWALYGELLAASG